MAIVNKPNDYFNTKLYTGTNTTQSITGVGFQPDFTWIKRRNFAWQHKLQDSVRGATKSLMSATTSAELTFNNQFLSFDADGFTLGADLDQGEWNYNTGTYASWNWKAGGTAVSNTAGSITSSVSANTTSGFSVVSWTGTGVQMEL
jgi:hypothetical protein